VLAIKKVDAPGNAFIENSAMSLFSAQGSDMHALATIPRLGVITRRGLAVTLLWLLSSCAVMFVSLYDKQSVERSTEISKQSLALYQQLLATEPTKRRDAVAGPLGKKFGEIETQIRVHLLLEQARAKNKESIDISTNLLASWQKFSANHLSGDHTALSDATLNIERGILERHLRSALIAEESKKLGGGAER
jgi:hypothetical protein